MTGPGPCRGARRAAQRPGGHSRQSRSSQPPISPGTVARGTDGWARMKPAPAQLRLLGPVEIMVDRRPRPVAGLRRRAVLAALGLRPGETVAADRLIDIVWADEPPATPSNT